MPETSENSFLPTFSTQDMTAPQKDEIVTKSARKLRRELSRLCDVCTPGGYTDRSLGKSRFGVMVVEAELLLLESPISCALSPVLSDTGGNQ